MTALLIAVAATLSGAAVTYLAVSRRAAGQLAHAQSTADRLLANASDAIIACAADGVTITMWNPAAERLFGWRSEEVIGRQVPTLGDARAEQERSDLLDRVRGGERVSVVTRRVRKDGTPIVVRISYSALPAADGGFNGWMGTVADVTEELEIARERSERAALVERLNGIVADINAELDLVTVLDRITEAARELSGASAAGFALVDDEGVRIASACGSIADWTGYRFAPGEGAFQTSFTVNRQLVIEDYQAEPNRVRVLRDVESAVVTPVRVRDEHIGALTVFYPTPGRHASDAQLEAVRLLAGHAGTAVANAAPTARWPAVARSHRRCSTASSMASPCSTKPGRSRSGTELLPS